MNFKELRQSFTEKTADIYAADEALAMFYIVAEYLTKWGRSQLMLRMESQVDPTDLATCDHIITELKNGKPIQYILGEAFFYGLKFRVGPGVLIPRPETEELVDWIIHNPVTVTNCREILDIGTGSGCIAITLKINIQDVVVHALDVSPEALSIAQLNADLNSAEVQFILGDILTYTTENKYDLIVSNPPYVKYDEKPEMHRHVLDHEPHLALFVENEQPLVFYEAIAKFAKTNLKQSGLLYFEINEYLGKEMIAMLKNTGFKQVELKKDMQGKDRMICCSL